MIKSRLAPTPSGFLHVGNAYNFLFAFLLVHKYQGLLHLRIDDYDVQRAKQVFIDDLFRQLEWLGICWDTGPQNAAEVTAHSQQKKQDVYLHYIDFLQKEGLLFACSCTRKTTTETPYYQGNCIGKNFNFNEETNWRLLAKTTQEYFFDSFAKETLTVSPENNILHPIIKRKDGLPAYQLISLIDDVEYGINCIVRGKDLLASSVLQIFLAHQLKLHTFIDTRFYHHPLILDNDGNKLSKSAGSFSLADFRKHHEIGDLYRSFANWLGINNANDILNLNDLQYGFNKMDY